MEHRAAILSSLIRGLEPELDEAAALGKGWVKKNVPIIHRPKFDEKGNVVLTQHAKQNITQGKKSRKLTGQTYKPSEQKRFGEAKELEEAERHPSMQKPASRFGPWSGRTAKDKATVLVSPKGYKGGGKVSRIPKSQYDPKKHSLAEEQLDELKKETLASYVVKASKKTKQYHNPGIKRATDRLTGTYEVGKERKFMVPGDESGKVYSAKKKKIYHAEETQLDEVITKSTPAGDVIHDFVHSKNKVFKGDDKKQRIKRALGAYYGKQRGE